LSLILDALRRADSQRERERGAVPGLHAQQMSAATAEEAQRPAGARPWWWFAIVAGTGLLAVTAAWYFASREAPRQIAAPAAVQPAVAPAPAAPAAPPSATVAAAAPSDATTPPRAGAVEPQPVAEPAPWPPQDGSRKAPTAEVAAAPAARAPEIRAVPPANAAPVDVAIVPRGQLPENVRSQLPPLAVGGSIYSSNAPDRSVIIDGRILRENDRLGADLTLEQIRPKSAVLRFRGYRFEIGF